MAESKNRDDDLRSYRFRRGYQGDEALPPGARPPRQPSADVPAKKTQEKVSSK